MHSPVFAAFRQSVSAMRLRLPIALALLLAPVLARAAEQADFVLATAAGNRLTIAGELSPPAINRMHSWRLRLTDAAGAPIAGAQIEVRGGMPDHDHGLPTRPEVSAESEPGSYLLQGVRFHMPGRWLIEFDIRLGEDSDSASLEFRL